MKSKILSIIHKKIQSVSSDFGFSALNFRAAKQRGFTLLLAAIVSSIVLSLGASIFILAKKEVTLSSLGRDSQVAFYSADQGAECALYWDSRWSYFGTSSPPGLSLSNLRCNGKCLVDNSGNCAEVPGRFSGTYPYIMYYRYTPSSATTNYCVDVYVEKCDGAIGTWNMQTNSAPCTSSVPPVIHTTIHADGYSTSCDTLTINPRTLQRSVELHY